MKSLRYSIVLIVILKKRTETIVLSHLRQHLKKQEMLKCPYTNCTFESNVYSTFNAHKSKDHRLLSEKLRPDITLHIAPHNSNPDETLCNDPTDFGLEEYEEDAPVENLDDLQHQLEHNLALLFLKLQAVLHISDMALQEVIQQLNQIVLLSEPLLRRHSRYPQ